MLNFSRACQILPQVWHLPDFFLDIDAVRSSYRTNGQPWTSQYPNRLLTPWNPEGPVTQALNLAPDLISELTGIKVRPQVGYASLDLSGSTIMMHRLHPDIGAYIQVYMGQADDVLMGSMFCNNATKNALHEQDYADITEFEVDHLTQLKYRPNDAWLMINNPRCFFGSFGPVNPNRVRETVCLHFATELPSST